MHLTNLAKTLPVLVSIFIFLVPAESTGVQIAKIIVISVLLVTNTRWGEPRVYYLFVFFLTVLLISLLPLFHLWNPMVAPTVIFTIIVLSRPNWFERKHWLLRGDVSKASLFLAGLTVPLSALALIGWAHIVKPDLTIFSQMIPGNGVGAVFAAAIIFSLFNALAEEIAFRGLIWRALELLGFSNILVLTLQAIVFGMFHYGGVPSGWSGMVLATVYGLALGGIRHISKGIMMPIVVHAFADLTIFLIIMRLAGRL